MAGKYEDKTDYASETLQEYHFIELLRIKEDNKILKKRIKQAINIVDTKSANIVYDTLMREILDIGIFGASAEELPDLLNEKYGERNIFVTCPVSNYSDAGFIELFKLLKNIKRKAQTPFVLLFEFENQDYEKLLSVFNNFSDEELYVNILPELKKVSAKEISDFHKNNNYIFYENSLMPSDAPIYYKEAITKLKLK